MMLINGFTVSVLKHLLTFLRKVFHFLLYKKDEEEHYQIVASAMNFVSMSDVQVYCVMQVLSVCQEYHAA